MPMEVSSTISILSILSFDSLSTSSTHLLRLQPLSVEPPYAPKFLSERFPPAAARGDVKAVRSLVELGEPYRDNHCDHLEEEIDRTTAELEGAKKKLRDLSSAKEELAPELDRLKASASKQQP